MSYKTNTVRVDIGIITIRDDEYIEVLAQLPTTTVYDGAGERRYRITNLTSENGSNVSIAVTRCAEQGNIESGRAASDLMKDVQPQWIFVVGIAGGVPHSDFSLGDVVISSRIYDLTLEASKPDGEREYSIKGESPHDLMRRLTQDIPAMLQYEIKDWNTRLTIERPVVDIANLDNKLFGDDKWKSEIKISLIKHFSSARKPLVVVGPIASSDRLVKDSEISSAWLQVVRHFLGIEMELAGVSRAVSGIIPVIGIRGISDIVGLKRDDVWTNYAAKTAAAFTVALIASGLIPLYQLDEESGSVRKEYLNETTHRRIIEQIEESQQIIEQHLGIDRSSQAVSQALQQKYDARKVQTGSIFAVGGLCENYIFRPMPNQYYVAQEFVEDGNDLKDALSHALKESGYEPVRADDYIKPGHKLCKISSMIESTPFGVYQLTSTQDRNVHLELGIAFGLGRPFVLVKNASAAVAPLLEGLDYYQINSFLEMRYDLANQLRDFFMDLSQYQHTYASAPGTKNTVIIAHGDMDVADFSIPIAQIAVSKGLTPVFVGKSAQQLEKSLARENLPCEVIGFSTIRVIDEVVQAVQSAKFGVYRIDKECSADNFVIAGISMGLGCRGMLLNHARHEIPTNLCGIGGRGFTSFTNLKEVMEIEINKFLETGLE